MSASKTKRCSCSSSGYSSQSLASEHDAKKHYKPNQKYVKHNCKTLTSSNSTSKPSSSSSVSSCALDSCSRSSSTNICNQTAQSSSMTDASSCCIRTSTPTIASLQLLVNNSQNQSRQTSRQNVNYNYCHFINYLPHNLHTILVFLRIQPEPKNKQALKNACVIT